MLSFLLDLIRGQELAQKPPIPKQPQGDDPIKVFSGKPIGLLTV
jgi:hypothetical protein